MASSGKPKTTMAKLKREAALRERRLDKAARKRIRQAGQPYPDRPVDLDVDRPLDPDDDLQSEVIESVADGSSAQATDQASGISDPEPILGVVT